MRRVFAQWIRNLNASAYSAVEFARWPQWFARRSGRAEKTLLYAPHSRRVQVFNDSNSRFSSTRQERRQGEGKNNGSFPPSSRNREYLQRIINFTKNFDVFVEKFLVECPFRIEILSTPLILVQVTSSECVIKRSWVSGPAVAAEEPLQALRARVSSRRRQKHLLRKKGRVSPVTCIFERERPIQSQRSQRSNALPNVNSDSSSKRTSSSNAGRWRGCASGTVMNLQRKWLMTGSKI